MKFLLFFKLSLLYQISEKNEQNPNDDDEATAPSLTPLKLPFTHSTTTPFNRISFSLSPSFLPSRSLSLSLSGIYRGIDEFLEGQVSMCYCRNRDQRQESATVDGDLSETLFGRKNVFRETGFLGFSRKWKNSSEESVNFQMGGSRWSDCGCESCLSRMSNGGDHNLHVRIRQPSQQETIDEKSCEKTVVENVIFLHGFLSSSSLWTESVFQNLSKPVDRSYRLFAVDLLGFGRSPKPRDCFYTLKDHLEMIEKSVISRFQLDSFHLVAHSMGCNIAIALAAKHSKSIKSITLVAP
ncbi:probable lysophospholipase BODYGUARD 4 [Humulus lupulus]|uniref:probable lysophospholipase BODYGUARD 4 n=1 Tax=Humulus lupulus TaxID=3486 RepID=UPI002B41076B|nr:probable lysophospholipase BODYGUARD 4 [Humulus lupulus]